MTVTKNKPIKSTLSKALDYIQNSDKAKEKIDIMPRTGIGMVYPFENPVFMQFSVVVIKYTVRCRR